MRVTLARCERAGLVYQDLDQWLELDPDLEDLELEAALDQLPHLDLSKYLIPDLHHDLADAQDHNRFREVLIVTS